MNFYMAQRKVENLIMKLWSYHILNRDLKRIPDKNIHGDLKLMYKQNTGAVKTRTM